ncbi:MAG: hypothetical protein NVSMB52_14580 [Chloroflexota bacterium]
MRAVFDIVAASSGSPLGSLIGLIIAVVEIVAVWKIFTKANQHGWAAIIPFYNYYVMLKLIGKPGWWLVGFFIPFVNIVLLGYVLYMIPKTFGKSTGFCAASIIVSFITYPMLAFGNDQYQGPEAASGTIQYAGAGVR